MRLPSIGAVSVESSINVVAVEPGNNFTVEIKSKNTVYSILLNKLFVKPQEVFTIEIQFKPSDVNLNLRVYASFTTVGYEHVPIEICNPHKNYANTQHFIHHIMKNGSYIGHKEEGDHASRLALLFPLKCKPNSVNTHQISLQAPICTNMCFKNNLTQPNKKVALVFTLEKTNGDIVGEKKINYKVCSHTKLVKDGEENKKSTGQVMNHRKRKLLSYNKTVSLTITMPDQDSMIHTLDLASAFLANEFTIDPKRRRIIKPHWDVLQKQKAQLNGNIQDCIDDNDDDRTDTN